MTLLDWLAFQEGGWSPGSEPVRFTAPASAAQHPEEDWPRRKKSEHVGGVVKGQTAGQQSGGSSLIPARGEARDRLWKTLKEQRDKGRGRIRRKAGMEYVEVGDSDDD